jgi:hypothetical protein
MAAKQPPSFCPYKGLQPYTEIDRAYFFGRERDREIIAANLYAAPLTILYGASGVGKSSVLLAGVVPHLRQTPRLAIVIFRAWQDAAFVSAFKHEVLRAVGQSLGNKEISVDPALPFDDFLLQCTHALRGTILVILDQFEEYFLYHPPLQTPDGFDAEFARAVNRKEIDVNFLLSIREDGLSKLDRFQGRIPNLLSNTLRLEHLDREAAISAIRKPLDEYNRSFANDRPPLGIEDELIEELLDEVRTGKVTLRQMGQGQVGGKAHDEPSNARIETPFLQMVLTRLWDEEMAVGSDVLRLSTLKQLGGAERIVRTHLDKEMDKLSPAERKIAARLFRFLVTPTGTKIALTPGDLVTFAELPTEQMEHVEPLLARLSLPDVRILRSVAPPPDQPDARRYEIFHDVLAPAILDWRLRYDEWQEQERIRREEQDRREQERAEAERQHQLAQARRLRWGVVVLALLLLAMGGLTFYAFQQRSTAMAEQLKAEEALAAFQNAREQTVQKTETIDAIVNTVKSAPALAEILPIITKPQAVLNQPSGKGQEPIVTRGRESIVTRGREPIATTIAKQPITIYIHIRDERQREGAQQIAAQLEKKGFVVPGIQLVDTGPPNTWLRYFHTGEQSEAIETVKILDDLNIDAKLQYVPGYETPQKVPLNQFVLWFASNS